MREEKEGGVEEVIYGIDKQLETLEKSGWPENPWFLEREKLDQIKIFREEDVRRANEELRYVYTYEACKDIIQRRDGHLVSSLITGGYYLPLYRTVKLGLDLAFIGARDKYPEIHKRLRVGKEYGGAVNEVAILAELVKANYNAEFANREHGKSPDIVIRDSGNVFYVECKLLKRSILDSELYRLQDRITTKLMFQSIPKGKVLVEFFDSFATRIESEKSDPSRLVADVSEELSDGIENWAKMGFPEDFKIGEIAKVELNNRHSINEIDFCPGVNTSAEDNARRAADTAFQGARQIPKDGIGVVLISAPNVVKNELFFRELRRKIERKPDVFSNSDVIAVSYKETMPNGEKDALVYSWKIWEKRELPSISHLLLACCSDWAIF